MGDKYIIKEGFSKYPGFHYKELEDLLKSKSFSEDSAINYLKILKNQFEQLTNELNNIIESNLNNFNIQSILYNRKTYDYFILSKLDLELGKLILYKLSHKYITDKIN